MKAIRNARDFWAGALFVAAGIAALVLGRGYDVGTTAAMGPGYFPRALGLLLAVLGAVTVARSLRPATAIVALPPTRARPVVLVLLSIVAFGVALPRLGLVAASMLLVITSRAAAPGFKWIEVLVLGAGLTVFCVAVFVWGLGMPMALWPPFLGG